MDEARVIVPNRDDAEFKYIDFKLLIIIIIIWMVDGCGDTLLLQIIGEFQKRDFEMI